MSNPIFHLKDSYYFEIPKSLWRHGYDSLDKVPKFLRDAHPEVTDPQEFNAALDGKILIPQPFGELESLYSAKSGFAISKYMILEVMVGLVMLLIFSWVGAKIRSGTAPKGRFVNLFESMLVFVRDSIARPAIDDPHHHGHEEADSFVPLLWTLFFFILGCNLLGMLPWAGSPTASFAVTLAMAGVTFGTVLIAGMRKFGLIGFFTNQVPSMDLPLYLSPLKVLIFVIEIAGLLIKHLILSVLLLANMVAGHLVILGIMGLIVSSASATTSMWATVTTISVLSAVLFSILELFVAFLQAYIFTFLSALFIGASVHHH